jgi:hypothetical protein
MGKLARKQLVSSYGVRVPENYAVLAGPDAVDFSRLPSRFVLKPVDLCSSHGVYLLERQGGQFFEMLRKKTFSAEEILADLTLVFEKFGEGRTSLLAEELIVGENGLNQIPFDYKFWTFGEKICAIFQFNRNTKPIQLACFGPDFSPLPAGLITQGKTRPPGPHVVPANASAVIETARTISVRLDTPFCGIDLYTTGRDVYFGELTPTPGPPYHGQMIRVAPKFDRQLGDYWRDGCIKRGLPIPKISSPPPAILAEQSA